jgi:hypothetical protein
VQFVRRSHGSTPYRGPGCARRTPAGSVLPPMATAAPAAPLLDRPARVDLAVLSVASLIVRLPAFFAERHLTFDDGVFGASAVAMRHGGVPFREVFSSQGPLFLPLLWAADLVGLRRLDSPRVLSVAAGLVLVAAVYLAGRVVADRGGALLAAALTSACASVLWVTASLAADGVALAFATVTMVLVLRWRDDLTVGRAIWVGLAVSAAISVKSLIGVVLIPVAVVLLAGRRLWPIVAGAVVAVAFHLALWLPFGPGDVWDQAYAYHLDAAGSRTPLRNLDKTLSTLGDRDLPLVACAVLAVGLAAWAARATRTRSRVTGSGVGVGMERWVRLAREPDLLLWLWTGAVVLMLLGEHPMWRPHVSNLVPPIALLVARHRPPWKLLAAAGLIVLPYHLVHTWALLDPSPYRGTSAQEIAALRELPPGVLAISDDPGIVWRAGRRTTDDLVDASELRIETGRMSEHSVVAAAGRGDVCAVVVRSAVRWGSFDGLPRRLEALGYREVLQGEGQRGMWVRTSDACGASLAR